MGASAAWLWVPVVLFAALAQTVRNTAQRALVADVGTLAATLVRFLYGLPFALAYLLVLLYVNMRVDGSRAGASFSLLPAFSGHWLLWIAWGALFQVAATAALLLAMAERNFAVAVTWSKTEVLQLALFAALLLHEMPGAGALAAMLLASAGVLALALPPPGQMRTRSAWASRATLYGLACGACFALATVGFRGAALELERLGETSPWLSGAWGVLAAQTLQTLGLGAWIAWRDAAKLRAIARAWRVSLLAGSMGAAASLGWFTAYAMQGAATVRTLGMVEVVFSYIVSRRLLGQHLSRREHWAMALVVFGLALICWQARLDIG